MKKLSVIILTHNQPRELKRLLDEIESVPEDAELIIIDDNSTDDNAADAVEIVNQFNRRTGAGTYEYMINWAGCGGARNYGAAAANAEWIWFIDGDDLITRDAIPRIIKTIDEVKDKEDVILIDYEIKHRDGHLEPVHFDGSLRPWEVGITAWCKVIRKSILEKFRERVAYEDNDWWMRQCIHLISCNSLPVVNGGSCYTYHSLSDGSATSIIEILKIPDNTDDSDVIKLSAILNWRSIRISEAIADLFEDLAALIKCRNELQKIPSAPPSFRGAIEYMIGYLMRLLRIK